MDPLNPLIPYVAAAVGIALALVLFFTVKRDLIRSERRERQRVDQMLARLHEAPAAAAPAPDPEPVYIPVALRPGLNLNRRVHALRMLRRGDDSAHIAAVLGIPRREVELLARVQGIVQKKVAQAGG